MATSETQDGCTPTRRKELHFKLEVVKFYREKLSDSRWVVGEDQIKKSQKASKRIRKKIEFESPMLVVF